MNLTKLKTFAPAARTAFIAAVTRRAGVLGIREDRVEPVTESGDVAIIGGQPFPRSIVALRKKLLETIQRDGFGPAMEAMAYTWFNRLVALRFMELHDGWLDHGYRVLSHPQGTPLPEILQHAEHVILKGLDREEVIRLKLDGNRDEELYRLLLLAQCAELNHILPDVFSRLDDATILLLPDNLLHSDSLIRQLVAGSDPEDWHQVEVLGWLYQFYISEKKDAVMARKSAVPTEDIPAVTQLFTPHWIVRYLVENSLGRLWLLNRPGSRLREHMPYYIEGEPEADFLKITKPEEIRLCDPAVGSGHMLTYAFDLLTLIYEEEGYAPTEIPGLILRHNLHGLEICPRAAQLAELALVFKAREKSRRFFQPEHLVRPRIIELRDVRFAENELRDYIHALGLGDIFNQPVLKLLHQFEDAKNFGSLIQPCLDEKNISFARSSIEAKDLVGQLFLRETNLKVLRVLEQAEALTQRYHVVVANPPYMGSGQMDARTKAWAEAIFPRSKSDLYSMFIERSRELVLSDGFAALITMESWMFLSSFHALRLGVLNEQTLHGMIHMPYLGKGGTSMGINFGTSAVIWKMSKPSGRKARFFCLRYYETDEVGHPLQFPPSNERTAYTDPALFLKVQNAPFAYWLKNFDVFDWPRLAASWKSGGRLKTHDGPRFIRFCWETSRSSTRWRRLVKGGDFKKHSGNEEYLVDWSETAVAFYQHHGGLCPGEFRNREGICWAKITSAISSFRIKAPDCEYDSASPTIFNHEYRCDFVLLAFLNSFVARHFLQAVNPTLNTQLVDVLGLPFKDLGAAESERIRESEISAVQAARADWDNFETSWDFLDQPLLRPGLKGATLEASWQNWEAQSTAAIRRMQELETENNRLFIAAYGLDGELQPEVPEAQITLARADARRDMAAFLSYVVGCMMGRYSLDHPGLILANAGDTLESFRSKIVEGGLKMEDLSLSPDADGIVPVLDAEWFEDDIVTRVKEFLRTTFGEPGLQENLRFLEASLGKELRTYLLNDFYKDHLQTYKNRPVYWLFSSGKQKAFQCLVYLHRYTPGTLARIRTEYVIPLQGKFGGRITRLEEEVPKTTSSSNRKKLQTELDKTRKQMVELLAFDEQLRSYADQRIELDLDDGVKTNYAKLGPLLAEAKKICGKNED